MRAFVLSGGANYGAQQVGALEVLFEHGLQPDMVMGVSAGALNAAWVAAHPTLEGVQELARIWREDTAATIPPVGPLAALFRLIGGKDSLLSNDSLLQFIRRWPFAESTFGEFTRPRLYTVAARYDDGALRIFGDDPSDRMLDGLMSQHRDAAVLSAVGGGRCALPGRRCDFASAFASGGYPWRR